MVIKKKGYWDKKALWQQQQPRKDIVRFRLRSDEIEALKQAASNEGLSISEFIRKQCGIEGAQ